jgi:F-type H+-transporting ATPase subunit epsilon
MSTQKTQLQLELVSQEKRLLTVMVDSLTVMTSEGEVTILPNHISLFAKLVPGELIYRIQKDEHSVVVSAGFIDIGAQNKVTVMVDTAVEARDISEQKAQAAIEQAHQTMQNSTDRQELLLAEASLRRALLEIKVAQKSKKSKI